MATSAAIATDLRKNKVLEILINIGLGILAAVPLPLALRSRRSLEKSYPPPGYGRFVRNVFHLILMLLGVVIPWLVFWLSGQFTARNGANTVALIAAIVATFTYLVVRWRLHDSKTWG